MGLLHLFSLIMFLSAEIAAFINIQVSSFITDYNFQFIVRDGSVGLLLLVPLLSQLISVDFGACLYRSSVPNFSPVSLCTTLQRS